MRPTWAAGSRNKHSNKKLRAGHGGVGKAIVVGAKDRTTNEVRAEVVEGHRRAGCRFRALWRIMRLPVPRSTRTKPPPTTHALFKHESVRHSTGEYVKEMAHTNGIESFWATLKRAHKRRLSPMSPKHLQRYVRQFAGKHNDREADTIMQMQASLQPMLGKRFRCTAQPDRRQWAGVRGAQRVGYRG